MGFLPSNNRRHDSHLLNKNTSDSELCGFNMRFETNFQLVLFNIAISSWQLLFNGEVRNFHVWQWFCI
jgi:hypothetical protein